jgi:aminocarboxymuconate-semialdehyde decarboxylase
MKRREFLEKASVVTAGIGFVSCGLGAIASQHDHSDHKLLVKKKKSLTVDIHCHSYVHDVWDLIKDREEVNYLRPLLGSPVRDKLDIQNLDFRIQQMDKQGIDIQAVSLHVGQYHHWADRDLASTIVSVQNEKIAELCASHPDRFVGIGAVSLQHPDLAVKQMEHGIKHLDMRGFMITASVDGMELSDPRLHPFWAKAEEMGTVIFVHPRGFTEGASRFAGNGRLANVIGNPLETTVALSHLIFEGTLDKYPGVKICAAHGGGYLPSYVGRSDHCATYDTGRCKPVGKLPSEYLKQLYFDSLVYTREQLQHLIDEVGYDRVIIGTDFPFDMEDYDSIELINSVPALSGQELEAILGGTAASLLGIDRSLS